MPARLRRLGPRTFQVRLTFGFVGIVVLTLGLVSALVLNRFDDYFLRQQQTDLRNRAETVAAYAAGEAAAVVRPWLQDVVSEGGVTNPIVAAELGSASQREILADRLGQADVRIVFGLRDQLGRFVPSRNGLIRAELRALQAEGQQREPITTEPIVIDVRSGPVPFAVQVQLANPYTYRATAIASLASLLAAIGLFALGMSVIVAAVLARRFTTPLRRLTDASRALAEGDLSSRVPISLMQAGSAEIGELASQFNTMAAQLEESITIIRRDRDRSRDFLADVSHELRTPIAAVRMFNELLREHGEDDPAARREFLESTAQQLDRLDWLAQNLLELSKLDSGLVLLDLRPDDLRAAVQSSFEQAKPTARRRGVALHLDMPDSPIRIRHDPQRVGQVVANLVGNAIKFTPSDGSVTVEVRAVPEGARIEVRDTGVGIAAAELPRIFERFYRGSRVNEARGSGSGLGLAIVRSIVEMHGGTVTVESGVGAGSRFAVLLPRDARAPEEPVVPPAFERPVGEPLASRSGPLVAQDGEVHHGDPEAGAPLPRTILPDANVADSSPTDTSRLNPGTSP